MYLHRGDQKFYTLHFFCVSQHCFNTPVILEIFRCHIRECASETSLEVSILYWCLYVHAYQR